MSGEKKAKGWRFYGLVGFGAIVLLSAGVWALQYAGSGPESLEASQCHRFFLFHSAGLQDGVPRDVLCLNFAGLYDGFVSRFAIACGGCLPDDFCE